MASESRVSCSRAHVLHLESLTYVKVQLALESVSERGRVVLEGKELDLEVDK